MDLAEPAVYEGGADAVEFPMPGVAGEVGSEGDGVVHFTEGEGFVIAIVPPGTEEGAEVGGKVLFEVDADTGLGGAWMTVSRDIRGWVFSIEIGVVGLAVIAEIGVVEEGEIAEILRISAGVTTIKP